MTETINEIAQALYRLRVAFAKHGIPCPDVLEYSDTKKAYEAMAVLRREASYQSAQWAMDASAKPYAEMSIHGFTLRFEARQIERPGSGVELDDGVSGRIFLDDIK
jgi:hypothetical protein